MSDQRNTEPPRNGPEKDEPKRGPGAYIGNRPGNAYATVAPPNRRDRTGRGPGNRPPGREGGGGQPPSPSIAPRSDIASPQPDTPIGEAVRKVENDAKQQAGERTEQ